MTKLSKILNYVLYLLLALALVFAAIFYFGEWDLEHPYPHPLFTDTFLNLAKVFVIITAGVTLVFEVINIVTQPKNAVRTLISIVIVVVLVLIAYGMADVTPMKLPGYQGADNVPSMLSLAGTILYTMYFLIGGAVVAILYTELSRMFK
jgi:hypothetical protein